MAVIKKCLRMVMLMMPLCSYSNTSFASKSNTLNLYILYTSYVQITVKMYINVFIYKNFLRYIHS